MSSFTNWRRALVLGAVFLLAAGAVVAQEANGRLQGQVVDNNGDALPGVTVTITGAGAPQIQVTNADGAFRFLGLPPGKVDLKAELEGFSTIDYPNIDIRVNRTTSIVVELSPALEEVITVTSESPLLDERKITTGTTISQVELEAIPTARDPWSVLTQTPGVISDRINVGGNESGQQAVFRGPGVSDDENDFQVDGVQITDMAAIGASPTYYDFDQFAEMEFSTGGSDITKNSAGVSINLVTKRGTNEFRGGARFLKTEKDQFGVLNAGTPDVSGDLAPGQSSLSGNSIREINDFGFNAGGPVIKEKLFFWGSWGKNDIKQNAAGGGADDTTLENVAFKLNAQLSQSNSGIGSWNNGDKRKFGRGAGPDRSAESTWDQRGPTAIIKGEDTHVFSSNFFLTGQYSKVDGGFALKSKGGGFSASAPEVVWDSNGVWQNGFVSGASSRPAEEFKVDGSYFFNSGNINHELKFGGRYRAFERGSPFGWPGRNIVHIAGENFGEDPGGPDFFFLYRAGPAPNNQFYNSVWVQDTLTFSNLTVNVGIRYDKQQGNNKGDSVPNFSGCDPTSIGCLPGISFDGNDGGGFEWETISPRIGVTYALGEERKTLLRGSFSQFPEQLSSGNITQTNPLGAAYSYFLFYDANGNNMWDSAAVDGDPIFLFPSGFDPTNPSSTVSPNQTDTGLDPSITTELVVGVEHAFLPEFVAGLSLTYRNTDDILEFPSFIDTPGGTRLATRADYVPDGTATGTLPNGQPFAEPLFALDPAFSFNGGSLQRNGDRDVDYVGVDLTATKRLANRWMLRGYLHFEDTQWNIGNGFRNIDDPNRAELGADDDGGVFVIQSGGSGNKGDVILNTSWSANLNGMYQVAPDRPWGFNVAANLFAREGYPLPYFNRLRGSDGVSRDILVANEVDTFRTEDIFTFDLRLEKEFNASGNVGFTVGLDLFNVFNDNYVLQRERNLSGSRPNFLDETLSPRIWRIGVRLNWR